jgi:hypothetical protein
MDDLTTDTRPRCEVCGTSEGVAWFDDPDDPPGCWMCADARACQARLVADLDEGEPDWTGMPW